MAAAAGKGTTKGSSNEKGKFAKKRGIVKSVNGGGRKKKGEKWHKNEDKDKKRLKLLQTKNVLENKKNPQMMGNFLQNCLQNFLQWKKKIKHKV